MAGRSESRGAEPVKAPLDTQTSDAAAASKTGVDAAQEPEQNDSDMGYVVARGRSLSHPGRTYKAGEAAPNLSEADVAWLLKAGFIVANGSASTVGQGVAVGGLRVTGGRPPGHAVKHAR